MAYAEPAELADNPLATAPLRWTKLFELFLRPSEFFRSTNLRDGSSWWVVCWFVGMAAVIARVDQWLIRAEFGIARPEAEQVLEMFFGTWGDFWRHTLVAGALAALPIWFVYGWWYNLRLRWSGAGEFDRRDGRLVFMFSGLVSALPAVIAALVVTSRYTDYAGAWHASDPWLMLTTPFPLWAIVVSYKGVRARFGVRIGRASFWFLLLPLVIHLSVMVLLIAAAVVSYEPADDPRPTAPSSDLVIASN